MSTTDTRAAFEAYVKREENLSLKIYDLPHKPYQSSTTQRAFAAFKAGIAYVATDAPIELPKLPTHKELAYDVWGLSAVQMREYGQACAEAARQSLMQLFLDPENQPTQYGTVLAAQQPAPVAIKTWEERLCEKFPETADLNLFAVSHLEHAMESEIADLRAALAAAPASPQPPVQRASELTDDEIMDIADDNDCGRTMKGNRLFSDRNLLAFTRAILAASTPTTLTEKKE